MGNIIWTCYVGPVTSLSVAFISFAKKVAIDFYQFFLMQLYLLLSYTVIIEDIVLIKFIK